MKAFRRKAVLARLAMEFSGLKEWEFDFRAGLGSVSAGARQAFGANEQSGAWTLESLLQNVYEDDRINVARLFDSSCIVGNETRAEFRVVGHLPTPKWLRLSGIVELELGVPIRVYGVVGESNDRAQSSVNSPFLPNSSPSRLIAEMSHELRTPLNTIIGFADLLMAGAVPAQSPKHAQFLDHIGTAGRQLLKLTNDVLDLAKIASGTMELLPEHLHLPTFLAELLHSLPPELTMSADIQTLVDPVVTTVWADPVRLRQVLEFYLESAICRAAPNSTVAVRLTANDPLGVRLEIVPSFVPLPAIGVHTGAKSANAEHGTPAMLMRELCRQIIEAHGGMVRIQEAPKDAWKIELLLETKEVPLSDTLSSRSASVAQVPRLLAIQDGGRDPHKLSRRLMEAGFDVDTVISGEQAMARAAQNVYDAIALDLLIHGESGLSVLQAIRAEGPNASSPVVSVSIAPDTGDVASFAVTDILAKPIRTTEIVEAMRKLQLKLGRTARVLVIDDDPIAIDLMCATLGACHIECLGLSDGRKAIQEIEFRHPDALILDMMMPEFDGFAVLDSLRQSAAGRDIPVFIWTNMTLTWNEYMSLKRSAKAILSKGGGTIEAVRDDLRKRRLG